MTKRKQKEDEELHLNLFRKIYEKKYDQKFPQGVVEHKIKEKPDFLIKGKDNVLGIEHTEFFRKKSHKEKHSPRKKEAFREKIISDAQNLCEQRGVSPLEVKVLFKSLEHLSGEKVQAELSESIANSVEHACHEKREGIFRLTGSELGIPEIYLISVIRGTLDGQTWRIKHWWYEVKASWINRNFISELQACINWKNDRYIEYRGKCGQCWLLIVTNRSKDSQAFEITKEILQYKYTSLFERTFYMEVLFKEIYELTTTRNQKLLNVCTAYWSNNHR